MTQVPDPGVLAEGVSWLKGWKWTGNLTTLDLIAAGTNAAKKPAGVYRHHDGRPLLGRKLKGRSVREMASLGLAVDEDAASP
jgi:hypothetical protein